MHRRLIWALAPAALALATFAQAQPPGPPPGPGGGPVIRMIHGGPGEGDMKAMHEAMMRQHVEDMRTVLRLRPDQEAALQAFVGAHEPHMEMRHEDGPAAAPKPMTTPERLAEQARHEQAMAAEHEKARAALARFYAALSPDQQRVFDALQRLQGGPMGGGGHMMMMGMAGMDGGPGMRRIEIRRTEGAPGPDHEHH
jgi:protein CpxP